MKYLDFLNGSFSHQAGGIVGNYFRAVCLLFVRNIDNNYRQHYYVDLIQFIALNLTVGLTYNFVEQV